MVIRLMTDNISVAFVLTFAHQWRPYASERHAAVVDAPVIMCRGYEYYSRLSTTTRVLCDVHANPSSRVSWLAANELSHSTVSRRNITLSEQVALVYISL